MRTRVLRMTPGVVLFGVFLVALANGPSKRIQLDSNAALRPQARAMHEFGHIASYWAHPWQRTNDYTWGGDTGATWSQGSSEWGVSSFDESFATHYGRIAFWWDNAVRPTTCNTSVDCYDASGVPFASSDLEASSFSTATNNCDTTAASPESRRPISTMRFLWDVFDNRNDGDSYSANQGHFWNHLAMLAFYPEGTGANQIDEPWNSARTSVTERDGRGASSYASNYATQLRSIAALRTNNCTPP